MTSIPLSYASSRKPGFMIWVRRDPVLVAAVLLLAVFLVSAVFADWLAPYNPLQANLRFRSKLPSMQFWLGTDEQGRDILSRIMFGLRLTLFTGALSLALGMFIGSAVGLLAAYIQKIDSILMRLMDVLLSFPAILISLAIVGATGPGVMGIIIALTVATIGPAARISRSAALAIVSLDYVASARMAGLSHLKILFGYVFRNCFPAIIVYASLRFGQLILLGASLSFLGLGIAPPTPELGVMVSQGRSLLLTSPHVSLIPCAAIFLLVLSLNVVGDALRDALDPKMKD